MKPTILVLQACVKGGQRNNCGFKEETHAARWGLLRGYSGKATKWVDFVVTDSTRRESGHSHRVVRKANRVKGKSWKCQGAYSHFDIAGPCADLSFRDLRAGRSTVRVRRSSQPGDGR